MDCKYTYFYRGKIAAERNKTYTLEIIDGGKTYTATTTTSLTPVTIDKVSYTPAFKDLYGEHEGVITYFTDNPSEENYYRFEMTRKADVNSRDVTGNNRDLLVPCLKKGIQLILPRLGAQFMTIKIFRGNKSNLLLSRH